MTSIAQTRGRARLRELGDEVRVLPSILSADFAALAAAMAPLESAGAAVLHIDVMDGHFVDNITFGPPVVRSVRAASRAFLDTHLMITDPMKYLPAFADAGADLCTIHAELPLDPREARAEADRLGIGLGVAIRPSTELDPSVERWAPHVDLILVMSVEPGFGGQKFISSACERLQRSRVLCQRLGVAPILEVDGGINTTTAPLALSAGAQWLVAGSAVFGADDPVAAWRGMSQR